MLRRIVGALDRPASFDLTILVRDEDILTEMRAAAGEIAEGFQPLGAPAE